MCIFLCFSKLHFFTLSSHFEKFWSIVHSEALNLKIGHDLLNMISRKFSMGTVWKNKKFTLTEVFTKFLSKSVIVNFYTVVACHIHFVCLSLIYIECFLICVCFLVPKLSTFLIVWCVCLFFTNLVRK